MKLLFLYGPPAVGKLTTAHTIGSKTGMKVFHNHLVIDMVESVFEFGTPNFIELSHSTWLNIIKNAEELNIDVIMTYCYDHNRDYKFIKKILGLLEVSPINKFTPIQLVCREEVLMKRVTGVSRQKFNKSHTEQKLSEVLKEFNYFFKIPIEEHRTIDTSDLIVEDVADIIINTDVQ